MKKKTLTGKFSLYGLEWPWTSWNPITATLDMIRGGGKPTDSAHLPNYQRIGLFQLYRDFQTLVWPDDDHHEWSDLLLQAFINERLTAVMGPKDCGKTRGMAKFALIEYWIEPRKTLVLMSSTGLIGAELRVYGDLKDLFMRAREVWPDAPGNPVDSMKGIFTDALGEDSDIRDIRRGVVCLAVYDSDDKWKGMSNWVGIKQKRRRMFGDECFPAGTLVDTPYGPRAIEEIQPGDLVISAIGASRVLATSERTSNRLTVIEMSDGRRITCTPNHPVLTQKGWKKACEVSSESYILSAYEAMRCLRENDQEREAVQSGVQGGGTAIPKTKMQDVRPPSEVAPHDFLREVLLGEVATQSRTERDEIKMDACRSQTEARMGRSAEASLFIQDARGTPRYRQKNRSDSQGNRLEASSQRRQRNWTDQSRARAAQGISRVNQQLSCANSPAQWERVSTPLQGGRGFSWNQIGNRSRWGIPQQSNPSSAGSEENRPSAGAWVVRVTVQESGGVHDARHSDRGCKVYNLQVAGHPSYSVNGFLVHNCQFYPYAFLSTLSNLDKGDFKAVFTGNPIPNGKALDRMAEPLDGYDALGDITKTTTWRNKWGGLTINFVGPDSPAIHHPGRFEYLINQTDIDTIITRWGLDSEEYWNQAKGVRPPDVSLYRVLSRDLALKFHAMDDVVWRGEETVKGYAIDASYGGDRCVGGMFEFGKDINGTVILKLGKTRIIPIKLYAKSIPIEQRKPAEDQIADFVRADCESLGIPSAHVFHDATGRGSLGSAFARLWRHDTNPVEFGGAPSDRPVLEDLQVYDEELHHKRPMRCSEYYSKRVTEYWFAVRHIIESGQLRGLAEDVLGELCIRQWDRVRGDKKEVEKKEDLKERLGHSCDLGDWAAICCEGARRLGFTTTRLMPTEHEDREDDSWKMELQRRMRDIRRNHALTTNGQLTYA